jgi:transcriptional regulator with XRE-family HTH domain
VNQLLDRLSEDLNNEDNRYAYADAMTNAFVSAQIKALKEDRKLSQGQLAELIGTQQSGISRLLRSDYSAWHVETLRKLARAFGVRLRISFEEFGTLIDDVTGFNKKNLLPRKFEDDPVFDRAKRFAHRRPPSSWRLRFSSSSKRRKDSKRRKRSPMGDVMRKPPRVAQRAAEIGRHDFSGNNFITPIAISSFGGNQSTGQPGAFYGD